MVTIAANGNQPEHLLVISGKTKIVKLGLDGKRIAEQELSGANQSPVQHITTAVDGDGNRFYLAWSNLGRQARVFDATWTPVGSYPDAEQEHDGIRDCLLADLDGDGTLNAYVAFWGAAGVHEVSLDGKRQWTNRAANGPMSLTAGPANAAGHRRLLISTSSGDLLPLNPFGREEPPQSIGSYAVHDLVKSQVPDMLTPFCALSFTAEGTTKAIAVDADFVERWSYELPPGAHRNAVRPVVSGKVLPGSQGDWIFAGADGSVHLVAADGSASDYFYLGKELTGLAVADGMLVLATEEGITASRLSAK